MTENNSLNSINLDEENDYTDLKLSYIFRRTETPTPSKLTNQDLIKISKRLDELELENKQLREGNRVCFSQLKNKWRIIDYRFPCCENRCLKTDRPNGYCYNGNGFILIENDTDIKYIECSNEVGNFLGINEVIRIKALNQFNKPSEISDNFKFCFNCTTSILFYFEVKYYFKQSKEVGIGLRNNINNIVISLWPINKILYYFNKKDYYINLPSFTFNNNDVIGCGVVYPHPNILNKLPYVFFTHNGKLIGKAILLNANFEYLQPFVDLQCCSIETNFGNDLNTKPFIYNISKHYLAEEFYRNEFMDFTLTQPIRLLEMEINNRENESELEIRQKDKNQSFFSNVPREDIIRNYKKSDDFTFLSNPSMEGRKICFIHVKNKLKLVTDRSKCCEYNCVNNDKPNALCISDYGFIQIINDTNAKYIRSKIGDIESGIGINRTAQITADNYFDKPNKTCRLSKCCLNCEPFSLFYYEIKKEPGSIEIGFKTSNDNCIYLLNSEVKTFGYFSHKVYASLSLIDSCVIGCGLVYPPPGISSSAYAFLTIDGLLFDSYSLGGNYEYLQPYIELNCSIEVNFGEDLNSKPFLYDISRQHYKANIVYEDELISIDECISPNKRIDELAFQLKQLKEGKSVCFNYVENKWKFIDTDLSCCDNKCVNTENPLFFCTNGNGFVQIKSDTIIDYNERNNKSGFNERAGISTENKFIKPNENSGLGQYFLNFATYLLYFYEVKLKFEKDTAYMEIKLHGNQCYISLCPKMEAICYYFQNKKYFVKLPSFTFQTDDIIGCGVVYPHQKMTDKLPYVFFTHNGKQIGKAILLKENVEYLQPYVLLRLCSVETNFGSDLKSTPFRYNISKLYLAEEFYNDEELTDRIKLF